ncbi:hypothetical protein T492DRAFT_879643 [Pavlovales sp. CCMP2436]|nr:hypothetical protein T492DRAFT_879643 [Pavlovales sp. CCMP2436]
MAGGFPFPGRAARLECFVALLGLVAYLNALRTGFVFDDNLAILENKDAMSSNALLPIFVHDFWGRPLNTVSSHKSYRPLTILSYRANNALIGGVRPECSSRECPGGWGYHLTNAALHALVCALVARLTRVCTGAERLANTRALIAGSLFAVHPVHCEAVVNLVGRAELLTAMLICAAFLLHASAAADGVRGLALGAQETALFAMLAVPAHEVLVVLQGDSTQFGS